MNSTFHEWSVGFLNYSAFIYLASMFCLFIGVLRDPQKSKWVFIGKYLAFAALLSHTSGLLTRW